MITTIEKPSPKMRAKTSPSRALSIGKRPYCTERSKNTAEIIIIDEDITRLEPTEQGQVKPEAN